MSNDDAPREDPTFASDPGQSSDPAPAAHPAPASDSTQSISQSTPPTQAIPEWTAPYPGSGQTETAPPPPPAPYPYAGSEPFAAPPPPAAAPTPPPPAAYPGYGQPTYSQPTYGQQAYGQPVYGPPPPAALPQYGVPGVVYQAPQTNTSGLVLTIIAGLLTFSCYFTLVGIPSLIIGIVALTKQNTDISGSRRLSRIGWITMAIIGAIHVVVFVALIVWAIVSSPSTSSSSYEY